MLLTICALSFIILILLIKSMIRKVPEGYFEVESARNEECYLTRSVRYPGLHMVIPYPGQKFDCVEYRSSIPMFEVYSDGGKSVVAVINYKAFQEGIPKRHKGNPEEAYRQRIGMCVVRVFEDVTCLLPKESITDETTWQELAKQINNRTASRLFNEHIAALEWLDIDLHPITVPNPSSNSAEGLALRLPDQTGGLK